MIPPSGTSFQKSKQYNVTDNYLTAELIKEMAGGIVKRHLVNIGFDKMLLPIIGLYFIDSLINPNFTALYSNQYLLNTNSYFLRLYSPLYLNQGWQSASESEIRIRPHFWTKNTIRIRIRIRNLNCGFGLQNFFSKCYKSLKNQQSESAI